MAAAEQPTVLVVEDEPAQREVLSYNFEAEGFRVSQAGNGEEALILVEEVAPDVIVLGGGVSNVARLYSRVPELWGAHVFSDRVDTRLVPNRHGDSSGVRGAAWLWPAEASAR